MTPQTTEPPNIADMVKALKADIKTVTAFVRCGGKTESIAQAANAAERISEAVRQTILHMPT